MPSEPTLEQWYAALGSAHGIIIDCCGTPPDEVAQKFYALRKTAMDPDLDCLSISPSPTAPERELWIYRSKK
jgi:hypothetical protein